MENPKVDAKLFRKRLVVTSAYLCSTHEGDAKSTQEDSINSHACDAQQGGSSMTAYRCQIFIGIRGALQSLLEGIQCCIVYSGVGECVPQKACC